MNFLLGGVRSGNSSHVPAKGAHLVRYYGWYSNKARGMRRKALEQFGAIPGTHDLIIDLERGIC